MFISKKFKKLKDFIYLFIYLRICLYLHEVENIHQYVFSKKYLMIYTTSFLREKLENVYKSISKKTETFVMFLYLRNGKCVSNFISCFYLIEYIVTITYSFFTNFSTNFKVSKQDTLFARN